MMSTDMSVSNFLKKNDITCGDPAVMRDSQTPAGRGGGGAGTPLKLSVYNLFDGCGGGAHVRIDVSVSVRAFMCR